VEFRLRLKKFRVSSSLSQREAARRIGVSESTYRAWEYGNAIQGEPYPQIAKSFGISLDELFGIAQEETVEEQLDKIVTITHSIKNKIS
jgi:transcriptional regulator with XRE-family HTH domain